MTMSKRDRMVLMVLAALIAVGGTYWFLIKPARSEAAAQRDQLTAIQGEIDLLTDQVSRLQAAAEKSTERVVEQFDVRTPSILVTAGSLSGGNQQKLIVGREMSHAPRVLLAAHPTRGVDVGAQAAIWDLIKAARRDGMGVLLISADLEELVGLSDTIRVILRGRLSGEFDPNVVTREELGAAMTGAAGEEEAR